MLPKIRAQHPRMPFIWMGDSLYATSPFIEEIRKKDDKFIFRVKEGDHKDLYTELKDADFCTFKISNDVNCTQEKLQGFNGLDKVINGIFDKLSC